MILGNILYFEVLIAKKFNMLIFISVNVGVRFTDKGNRKLRYNRKMVSTGAEYYLNNEKISKILITSTIYLLLLFDFTFTYLIFT